MKDTPFGQLRSFMNSDILSPLEQGALWDLITAFNTSNPLIYQEQRLPYMRDFAAHWQSMVFLVNSIDAMNQAALMLPMGRFALNLEGSDSEPKKIKRFLRSPEMTLVVELNLSHTSVQDRMVEVLAASLSCSSLRSLNLGANEVTKQGVQALAHSSHLPKLATLSLRENHITSQGLKALALAPKMQALEHLDLHRCMLSTEGILSLAKGSIICQLKSLDLGLNGLNYEGIEALVKSKTTTLESLRLDHNNVGKQGVRALASWPSLRSMKHLSLERCKVRYSEFEMLVCNHHLTSLRTLHMACNLLGDEGVLALAQSPYIGSLHTLDLRDNEITDQGAQELAQASWVENLRELHLGSNPIGDRGERALKRSPYLSDKLKKTCLLLH